MQSWSSISFFEFSPVFIAISLSSSGVGHLSSSITQYQLVSSNHHQKQSDNPWNVAFFLIISMILLSFIRCSTVHTNPDLLSFPRSFVYSMCVSIGELRQSKQSHRSPSWKCKAVNQWAHSTQKHHVNHRDIVTWSRHHLLHFWSSDLR